MSSATVTADARFFRRVFLTIVGLTLFTGTMAALAVAQSLGSAFGSCTINCSSE